VTREEFEQRRDRDEFLEWAQVFGHYYGTHRSYHEQAHQEGRDLLLDIDVQGARQLKSKVPEAVTVFILAPSREVLEQRLRSRSEDSEPVIQRRLREAAEEITWIHQYYDYVLVNNDVEESVDTLRAIVKAERVRRYRMEEKIRPILASFARSQS
jgi:guanylate kinase